MTLSPGFAYTIQRLPHLLLPPAIVYGAQKVAQYQFDIILPTWVLIVASVLSLPLSLTLRILLVDLKQSRGAAAHGAVLPPQVPDRSLGGMHLLSRILDNVKNGYPGAVYQIFFNR